MKQEKANLIIDILARFAFLSFFMGLCQMMLYRITIFRNVENFSALASSIIFFLLCGICWLVDAILSAFRKNRGVINTIVGAIFPLILYTFIAYPHVRFRILVCISIALAAVMGLMGFIIIHREKRKISVVRIFDTALSIGGVLCVAIVLLPMLFSFFVSNGAIFSKNALAAPKELSNHFSDTAIIEDEGDLLYDLLHLDEFPDIKKVDLLQKTANIEADYLGIRHLTVSAAGLEERVLGKYRGMEAGTIQISIDHLHSDAPKAVLRTLFHEVYHAYIAELTAKYPDVSGTLLFERELEAYRYEENHYVSGKTDIDIYKEQLCERRCNEYADKRLEVYGQEMIRYYGISW